MTDRVHNHIGSGRAVRRRAAGRAGFSFAEVLFAVIILGIGFILVAAIFPVAIQQTQSTAEDAAAAATARQATSTIAQLAAMTQTPPTGQVTAGIPGLTAAQISGSVPNPQYAPYSAAAAVPTSPVGVAALPGLSLFPPTVKNYLLPISPTAGVVPPPAVVASFSGPRWEAIRGNVILQNDPRYAYVPFYRRENGSSTVQLIVIAVASRNPPTFVPYRSLGGTVYTSDTLPPNLPSGEIYTSRASLTRQVPTAAPNPPITSTTIYPDLISFPNTPPDWLTEGCYLPSNNNPSSTNPGVNGVTAADVPTGRSYRLGRYVVSSNPPTFELESGDALNAAAGPDGLWGTADDVVDYVGAPPTAVVQPVPPATLQPVDAYASVYAAAGSSAGRITLANGINGVTDDKGRVAPSNAVPGAYVIIADDFPYGATATNLPATAVTQSTYALPANQSATYPNLIVGQYNGNVYRLGQPVPTDLKATPPVYPGTFELDVQTPAPTTLTNNGLTYMPAIPSGPWARVYVVGSGRTSPPTSADAAANVAGKLSQYSGLAQPVGVFTSTVTVP